MRPKMTEALETGEGFSHRFGKQFVLDAFGFDPEDFTKLARGRDGGASATARLRHCELFLKKYIKTQMIMIVCRVLLNLFFVFCDLVSTSLNFILYVYKIQAERYV